MCRTSDLKKKEVINLHDGRRLGFVSDVEINMEDGRLEAIIIPGPGRLFKMMGKDDEIVIPWERISKIGDDIVLVEMDERFMRKYFD